MVCGLQALGRVVLPVRVSSATTNIVRTTSVVGGANSVSSNRFTR
jgi:hypothetical protein